jgi:hypothetical protein
MWTLWITILAIGMPRLLASQALTGRDSSAVARSLAAYIRVHPSTPFGGDQSRLEIDTSSGTMTGLVGAAFRESVPDRWRPASDPAGVHHVSFAVASTARVGDTVTVVGAWNLCQAGVNRGHGRAVRYQVIRADSGWTVLSGKLWLIGELICNTQRRPHNGD